MKNSEKINRTIDYKKIRELSHRMDCTITEADFNPTHPNPCRIDFTASDIHRFLINSGGNFYGTKYRGTGDMYKRLSR